MRCTMREVPCRGGLEDAAANTTKRYRAGNPDPPPPDEVRLVNSFD